MKTRTLVIALALALTGSAAFAQEQHRDFTPAAYSNPNYRRDVLDRQVNHLNRMLDKVRWQVRHYRADWRIRREVQNISAEVDRLNHRFRSGEYNRWRMRRDIDRLRDRLHAIEDRLHVRSRDFYRWD